MRTLTLIATVSILTACTGAPQPPAVPPSDFSTQPILSGKGYAQTVIVQDFPMGRAALREWLQDGNKVVAAMEGGDDFAGPVDAVYFTGDWPEAGATRRVELSDGHYVLEKVLSNTDAAFEYQIWNATNKVGKNVSYVHGIQAFEPLSESETRMTWIYKVKPNAGYKRPFVRRFVNKQMQPMLSGALTRLAEDAEGLIQASYKAE